MRRHTILRCVPATLAVVLLSACAQPEVADNGIGDPFRGYPLLGKAMTGPFPYVIQAGGPIDRTNLNPFGSANREQHLTDRLVRPKFSTEELERIKQPPNERESLAYRELLLQARQLIDARRFDEAAVIAHAAGTIDGSDPQAPLLVARAFAGKGDADAAIAALRRYVELSGAPLRDAMELSGFVNIRSSVPWRALEIEAQARDDHQRKIKPPELDD